MNGVGAGSSDISSVPTFPQSPGWGLIRLFANSSFGLVLPRFSGFQVKFTQNSPGIQRKLELPLTEKANSAILQPDKSFVPRISAGRPRKDAGACSRAFARACASASFLLWHAETRARCPCHGNAGRHTGKMLVHVAWASCPCLLTVRKFPSWRCACHDRRSCPIILSAAPA